MMKCTTALAGLMVFAGAAQAQDIVVGEPTWFSGSVVANVLHDIIESRLDLDVEVVGGTNPEIFDAIEAGTGAFHIHADVWMPGYAQWIDPLLADGKIAISSANYNGIVGMCTPRYTAEALDLRSIDDMNRPDVVAALDDDGDGTVEYWVGGDGWRMTASGQVRLRDYGLSDIYEPMIAAEGDFQQQLYAAMANREHVVFGCYEPMPWFAMEFIEYIEEPAHDPALNNIILPSESESWFEDSFQTSGDEVSVVSVGYATEIIEGRPELANLLANFGLSNDDITEFMFMVELKGTPMDIAVADWMAVNQDRIDTWFAGGDAG